MGTDQSTNRRLNKVEWVVETYDLDGFGEQLADRWATPEGSDSLRDLADPVSKRALDAALRKMGENVLEGEVESLYTLFTGDETMEGMRVQTRNTL